MRSNVKDGASVLWDDSGRFAKLPRDVGKLKPRSIWVRRGRQRGFHGEAEAAAAALRR
jgi:hypothetical protein